jgi:hypothetical protein
MLFGAGGSLAGTGAARGVAKQQCNKRLAAVAVACAKRDMKRRAKLRVSPIDVCT